MPLESSDENRHCSPGKQQGGEALPNSDHSFEGYVHADIFSGSLWYRCMLMEQHLSMTSTNWGLNYRRC
eukprot:15328706-Ditylum_brightwellii.AAC.2